MVKKLRTIDQSIAKEKRFDHRSNRQSPEIGKGVDGETRQMKYFAYIIILAVLVLPLRSALSHPAFPKISIGQPDSPIPILNSSFYVGTRNAIDDELVWIKSNFVPSTPDNACYKWAIMLDTELSSISTREVFILPSKPKSWGYKEGMTLYQDSRVSVTEKVLEVDNGVINNGWCVTEGDPTGDYKIEVYINGVLAESFNFIVGLKL